MKILPLRPSFKKLTRPKAKQEFYSLRDKWYQSWWIDLGFVQELSMEKKLCNLIVENFSQKNSKCWSQVVSILVDRSTFHSRALGHKIVHTVDRSTNLVDQSTPY